MTERKTDVANIPRKIENGMILQSVAKSMDAVSCFVVGCALISALVNVILAIRSKEHRGWAWWLFVLAAAISFIGAIAGVFQGIDSTAKAARANEAMAGFKETLIALKRVVIQRNIEQANSAAALSTFKGIHVLISHAGSEQPEFTAAEIESLAKLAGWSVEREPKGNSRGDGIGVFTNSGKLPDGDNAQLAADKLVQQLKQQSHVNANTGEANKRLPPNTIRVYVGVLPNTPETSTFLTLQERMRRLTERTTKANR
jgi:hypothetical protein